jgi:predicted HNH restriction endonuclease
MNKIITCKVCGNFLLGKQTLYCSPKCKNSINQSYKKQQERGWKRKTDCVKKLGGKCSICGYNKNYAALTFHHKNPKNKGFQLDIRSLSNRKQMWINSELKKCILVCNNCHAELHYPKHSLEIIN